MFQNCPLELYPLVSVLCIHIGDVLDYPCLAVAGASGQHWSFVKAYDSDIIALLV